MSLDRYFRYGKWIYVNELTQETNRPCLLAVWVNPTSIATIVNCNTIASAWEESYKLPTYQHTAIDRTIKVRS